jgi:hypothetical protein
MLAYLRLSTSQLGLLINFNVPVLKDGVRRFVWHYQEEEDNAETQSIAEAHGEDPAIACKLNAPCRHAANTSRE